MPRKVNLRSGERQIFRVAVAKHKIARRGLLIRLQSFAWANQLLL